ncbi:MAG: 4Fe-4S ferredoxin, partial [Paludibacter sp.]|nr:4Fe-4S ferredoxin [Paludibacter sp.]
MEVLIEQILIYGSVALLIAGILALYVFKQKKAAIEVNEKIAFAQEEGLYEPVSLYPVIDPNRSIGSGACIR